MSEPDLPVENRLATDPTEVEMRRWWYTYGPQQGEDPVVRSLHEWGFLRLLLRYAAVRGIDLAAELKPFTADDPS